MRIDRSLWNRALLFESEIKRRGEVVSRQALAIGLGISESTARGLMFALENKDIIRLDKSPLTDTDKKIEIVMADIHIPYQDDVALSTMFDYVDPLNPDIIVILGDLVDFYQISRFIKNPAKKGISDEIKETKKFLQDLRARYPKAEIILYKGNHEDRMDRFVLQSAKEIYELVSDLLEVKLGLNELNIQFISEPFRIGKLWHLHGHEKQMGSYNPEYITNVFWKYIHDHFIVGHFHRSQDKIFKRIDNNVYWGGALGYLAKDLDYARLNAWNKGFGIIRYNPDGSFKAELRQIHNGEVY